MSGCLSFCDVINCVDVQSLDPLIYWQLQTVVSNSIIFHLVHDIDVSSHLQFGYPIVYIRKTEQRLDSSYPFIQSSSDDQL